MLGEKRVNELIRKFSIRYGVRNGVEGLEVHSPKGITPAIDKEIKQNKPEILAEVKRRKEEQDRKIAEKKLHGEFLDWYENEYKAGKNGSKKNKE